MLPRSPALGAAPLGLVFSITRTFQKATLAIPCGICSTGTFSLPLITSTETAPGHPHLAAERGYGARFRAVGLSPTDTVHFRRFRGKHSFMCLLPWRAQAPCPANTYPAHGPQPHLPSHLLPAQRPPTQRPSQKTRRRRPTGASASGCPPSGHCSAEDGRRLPPSQPLPRPMHFLFEYSRGRQ